MNQALLRSALSLLMLSSIGLRFDCMSPACADAIPPTPDAVLKAIEKAAIFPAEQKVQARVNGVEAQLSTYRDKASKDFNNDCKISSVLAARELFNKFPDLVRVKVRYYDPLKLNVSDTVSVTVGDVAAFSSGQTSTDKLLASLEIHHEQEAAPQSLRSAASSAAASPSARSSIYGSNSKTNFVPISASGTTNDLVGYIQRDLGMKLAYPKGWSIAEKPDASALFHLSTVTEDGLGVLVQVYASPKIAGTLEQYARLTFDTFLRPTKDCRLNATRAVRFGKDGCIEGLCQDISMSMNGTASKAAFYYFRDGDKNVLFECIAPESQFGKIEPLFNSIMLSITPGALRAASSSTASTQRANPAAASSHTASTQNSVGVSLYQVPGSDVSFSYPSSWKVQALPGGAVKLSGMGPQNKYGEINLNSADFPQPSLLEIHANAVVEQLLPTVKDGRRLSTAHISGYGCDILRDTITFKQDGVSSVIQFAHFCHEGKIFSLANVCPGWTPTEANVFFDKILNSVHAR